MKMIYDCIVPPEAPMDEWMHIVNMLEWMSLVHASCPPCFERAQRKGERNYYRFVRNDRKYNLGSPMGRMRWKENAPAGSRIIPEDGKAWTDVLYRCHIRRELVKSLEHWRAMEYALIE